MANISMHSPQNSMINQFIKIRHTDHTLFRRKHSFTNHGPQHELITPLIYKMLQSFLQFTQPKMIDI